MHSNEGTFSMAATTEFANGAGGQMMPGSRPVSAKRPASAPVIAPAAKRQATKQEDKPNTDEDLDVLRASHSTILEWHKTHCRRDITDVQPCIFAYYLTKACYHQLLGLSEGLQG